MRTAGLWSVQMIKTLLGLMLWGWCSLLLSARYGAAAAQGVQPASAAVAVAALNFPETDRQQFKQLVKTAKAEAFHQLTLGQIIQQMARQLQGARYQAGLLDQAHQEQLVVSLTQFDCVLFVEAVVAIARTIATQDNSPQTFVTHIQNQRYRQGQLDGYCSRLHYFSDWIADNQQRGNVQNITSSLGGIPLEKQLNFMSQHRQSYPQLKRSEANYQCVTEMEANLASLPISYIPQRQIRKIYHHLRPGDIIAIATQIQGLDVTHTGLVDRSGDNQIGLIHASPSGSVRIAPDLETYVRNVEQAIGIIVVRPI